ncbi:MAG: HAMP domain-containing protein [Gemmatimonadetes bacterium]|nr:HAMP domain-containing protein [Gemmatimonadota bacterium]MYG85282.1 HAMP domain-containing protein [Gemmatimonadota bacterium]MYJ88949.1 HAMP domain-containing protein [Gemmatimonadota bacterium]
MFPRNLREGLWPRLLVSHIALATIPVLIVGLLLLATARRSIEDTVADGNLEVARRASNEIRLYIEQAQRVIDLAADNMDMIDATDAVYQQLIDNLVIRQDFLGELAVLDLSGSERLTTRLEGPLRARPDLALPPEDGTTISAVFIAGDGLPAVTIIVPVRRLDEHTGYLAARVSLKDMWDLVDNIQLGEGQREGFGNAYVATGNGRLIAHPERERVYRQDDLSGSPVGTALGERQSGTLVYNGASGEMVAAFATVTPIGWKVVIEQPADRAFARSRDMILGISVLMVISAAVASLIGVLVVRKIVRPIYELVRGAQLFARGRLTHTIETPGHGELTTLAREFNQMARELLEKERRLKQAERLATLSKFATILSHEIRNPLNSMIINLRILKRDMEKQNGDLDKPGGHYEKVISEIWRIDSLVENFLNYARPPDLVPFPHDINEVLDEVVATHRGTAQERGVRIDTRYQKGELPVSVDVNQIKQVFLNIMLNAFDAMEAGGTLTISTERAPPRNRGDLTVEGFGESPQVHIKFEDTGRGIDPGRLDRIFEVYYTSKSTGTGLGLPIAQQIVEKHGGVISVESTPGKGTAFTLTLPALEAEVAEPSAGQAPGNADAE